MPPVLLTDLAEQVRVSSGGPQICKFVVPNSPCTLLKHFSQSVLLFLSLDGCNQGNNRYSIRCFQFGSMHLPLQCCCWAKTCLWWVVSDYGVASLVLCCTKTWCREPCCCSRCQQGVSEIVPNANLPAILRHTLGWRVQLLVQMLWIKIHRRLPGRLCWLLGNYCAWQHSALQQHLSSFCP